MRPFALSVAALLLTFYDAAGQKLTIQPKSKPGRTRNVAAIEGRCAVIVRPDDKKIARMRSAGSEDDYNTVVNDNEYYVGTTVAFLDSTKVRQIRKKAHGILVFKSLSGQYFKLSLADVYWGIFLFNGRTKPIEADEANIGPGYRAYMKK